MGESIRAVAGVLSLLATAVTAVSADAEPLKSYPPMAEPPGGSMLSSAPIGPTTRFGDLRSWPKARAHPEEKGDDRRGEKRPRRPGGG